MNTTICCQVMPLGRDSVMNTIRDETNHFNLFHVNVDRTQLTYHWIRTISPCKLEGSLILSEYLSVPERSLLSLYGAT